MRFVLFLCLLANFANAASFDVEGILLKNKFVGGHVDYQKSKNQDARNFAQLLNFSRVKNKKDLHDEYLIYVFLAKKYPNLNLYKIEKNIRKQFSDDQRLSDSFVSSKKLIEQYKKNPNLILSDGFKKQIKSLWHDKVFSNHTDEQHFLSNFAKILNRQDHNIRMERMLWSGETGNAKRMMARVDAGVRSKAKLRLDIQSSETVEELFHKFRPFDHDEHDRQILIFDAIQWCKKRKLTDEGMRLMELVPLKNRIENEKWVELIKPFLRSMLTTNNLKNHNLAYKISSNHHIATNRIEYVEMEFLSGFIASEFLRKDDLAISHFANSFKYAKQDFRKSRAAYWIGKSYKNMEGSKKNPEILREKNKYFTIATNDFTTFYGQLAASELDKNPIKKYLINISQNDATRVLQNPLFKYYYNAIFTYITNLIRKIAKIITLSSSSKSEVAFLAKVANYFGFPDISIYIGNVAMYNMGYMVLEALYPTPKYKHLKSHQELNLAIIRRESNFDSGTISDAGSRGKAHGLMQIIPAAGIDIAKDMGVEYNHNRLLNPEINVFFGNHWLKHLLKKYHNSEILAIAAYNSGMGSVNKWIREHGDPRNHDINTLRWIEQIPFRETRYYVQSVLSSMMIYRMILNNS